MLNTIGWVYTINLRTRLGREGRNGAQHYTGWCERWRLEARLTAHQLGQGARMLAVARERGIGWHVGHLAEGTPALERSLKRAGHHPGGACRCAGCRCWTCQANRQGQAAPSCPIPDPFTRLSPAFVASLAVQIPAFLLPF